MQQGDSPEPGIYFNMPVDEYHRIPALSNSGIKQLLVSPLNYWHHNLNPDRTEERDTAAQRFGTATHCRLLEPACFPERYATEVHADDFPGALDTVDDLKK